MTKTFFKSKTIVSFYSKAGGRIPVVLIHGFCEDSRVWDEWLLLLHSDHPYLLIDLPGFGQSDTIEDISISDMADVVAAVMDVHKIEKCVLVGHSMGGYVACAFAERYGERLAGLCMFHSHPYADSEEKKEGRLKAVDFIHKNGHTIFVKNLIPKLFAYDYSKGYQSEVNRLIFHAAQYDPKGIIASLHAMRQRPDRSDVLKKIKCPVQFFIGKKDTAIPPEMSLAQMDLPDIADIQLYNDVGHMGMFKSPRRTSKAFRAFLKIMIPK